MHLLVPEILEEVCKAEKRNRISTLQKYSDNQLLKEILQLNFNDDIEFDLPTGEPPYKVSVDPIGLCESNLYAEKRRMYLLIKKHPKRPPNLKKLQIENIFIQILEGVHKSEAELMIALKDKSITKKYPGITEKLVREAFPNLLKIKETT